MSSTKYKQNLDITGDITLSGNINIGGGTIAGDADTDSVTFNADVTSHIIPDTNATYDLGTSTKTWREVFTSKINSASGDDLDIHSGSDIALYPTGNIWIKQNTKLIFEGTLPDDFEAKLQATSVTADRDIILPDASGTLALTSDIPLQNLTTTQRDALTPSNGDIIYNTSNNQFELYTNTSWAAMTKVVYDNLLPSSDFVDQITNIWSANPTTPADFATWAQTIASDGYEYGNIDLSTTPPTIRSADSLAWLNISTNNNPDPAQVTRWLDIVLPSLIEQSWFDVHTSNLVNGNVFSRVSDDTTPKLGGALDADGKNIENLGQVQIGQFGAVVFEGLTDDTFETTLTVTDPTADRIIFLPDATGIVALTTDLTAYISLATLKAEVAASTDFADFQSRIAVL